MPEKGKTIHPLFHETKKPESEPEIDVDELPSLTERLENLKKAYADHNVIDGALLFPLLAAIIEEVE